jgi:hypothetical protein
MASTPVFVGTPQTWTQQITTANTARDGSGSAPTVLTGKVTVGSRVDIIEIVGVGTVSAGMVRLFLDDLTNKRLMREVAVTAIVPSGTVAGFRAVLTFPDGLPVPAGWKLLASTHLTETFNIIAKGGDY